MKTDQETVAVSPNTTGAKQGHKETVMDAMGRDKKKRFLDITALIRSIQRAEGNIDCFRREKLKCDQVDCAWRPYCL